VTWIQADLGQAVQWEKLGPHRTLIHLAALPLLVPHLEALASMGLRRVVALSSTSVLTKRESPDAHERGLIRAIAEAEEMLAMRCGALGISWTIFRPTMVYGAGRDKNVSAIAEWVQRFRCFPLLGEGKGLRQPVHADDVAAACVAVLENPRTFDTRYELAGATVLSYRQMVEAIFRAAGLRPCVIRVPASVFRFGLRLARLLPRYRYLNSEMAYRMDRDMTFDWSQAKRDFDFSPRGFLP
jgi:nucleoside-diphosphate-sugar epimerase